MGITGTARIKPGFPDSSIIILRMINLEAFRMPPLATSIVDLFGIGLISAWIDSMGTVSNILNTLSDDIPDKYQLYHAYPNPFNALTTIKYQLPASSQVELTVYDIRGREVITLYEGNQPAGLYTVQWNADEVASGIYFYKLRTENFFQVKKLLLVK
jgi:hypothetical protein